MIRILKLYTLVLILLLCASCKQTRPENRVLPPDNNAQKISDFALLDEQGHFQQISYYSDYDAVVVISHGVGCPVVRQQSHDIEALKQQFQAEKVMFLFLNANQQDSRDSIQAETKDYGVTIPVMVDETQMIAKALGLNRTGEALLIDPKTLTIRYRGPINDRLNYEAQKAEPKESYLKDALNQYLSGKKIERPEIMSIGCAIAFHDENIDTYKSISYSKTIAPLLHQKCMACHRQGGVAPWAMTDYQTVKGWSGMMREVIRTKRMPPWQADPHVGSFKNDISLSIEEQRELLHWIESGAKKEADEVDPLLDYSKEKITLEWPLGKPDLILSTDIQTIPATGETGYRYVNIDPKLDQDIWVSAIHVRPTNMRAMHHAFVMVDAPLSYNKTAKHKISNDWKSGVIGTYAPGIYFGEVAPEGTAHFIPAHSKIKLQLHYQSTGKIEQDQMQVAFYFTQAKNLKQLFGDGVVKRLLRIPPYEQSWPASAEYKFSAPVTIFDMMPHMHYRGKEAYYLAQYPDNHVEPILSVPNYRFNWQREYVLKEPLQLPAGSSLLFNGSFDNSTQNIFNPDPAATIGFGERSIDEMFIGYFTYVYNE